MLCALCPCGYCRIYGGWCFYIDFPPARPRRRISETLKSISISFSTRRSLSHEEKSRVRLRSNSSCPNDMYYSHRWTESNRNSGKSIYDAISFHFRRTSRDPAQFKKNSLPFWCYEKTFIVAKRNFSRIVHIPMSILIINHSCVQPPSRRYISMARGQSKV